MEVAHTLNARGGSGRIDVESETFVASGRGYWNIASEAQTLGTQARALYESTVVTHSLRAEGCDASEDGTGRGTPLTMALRASSGGGDKAHVLTEWEVRRLLPVECERLQGLMDNWTLVPIHGKLASDSARYKVIGNSWAVPVVRWLGSRIQSVHERLHNG